MITDAHAIVLADELYRQTCARLKKRPFEVAGEIMFAGGLKVVALFDDNAKLAGVYQVADAGVVEFDGPHARSGQSAHAA